METFIKNLRPLCNDIFPGLQPVCLPAPLAETSASMRLLASSGDRLYLSDGPRLYLFHEGSGQEPELIATLDSDIRCALVLSESELLVATGTGLRRVCPDSGIVPEKEADFPPVLIYRTPAKEETAAVRPFAVTGNYTRAGQTIDPADLTALDSSLREAYSVLCSGCRAADRRLFPILARYRLLDSAGDTLYLSPAVLIGVDADGNVPLTEAVTMQITDSGASTSTLVAESYGVAVKISPEKCGSVARLQVEVSDEISPVNTDAVCSGFVNRSSQDGTFSFRGYLPGIYDNPGNMRKLIAGALEEYRFRVALTVRDPFAGTMRLVSVGLPSGKTPYVDDTAASGDISGNDFTATSMVRCGDIILAANPTVFRTGGSSGGTAFTYAFDTGNESYSCTSVIRFADGSSTVLESNFFSLNPKRLNPLICYPDADAVSLTLYIWDKDGICFGREFSLTAAENSDIAYFLADELIPQLLVTADKLPPVPEVPEKGVALYAPGSVLSFRTDAPRRVVSVESVSDFPIHTICCATGSSAAWDHVRARFYIFSRDGIFSAVCRGSAEIASVAKISEHPVDGPGSVAVTPENLFAITSDGALVRLSGVKCSVLRRFGRHRLLYDNRFRELILTPAGDAVRETVPVYCIDREMVVHRTFPHGIISRLNTVSGSFFISDDGNLYKAGCESDDGAVDVAVRRTVIVPRGKKGSCVRVQGGIGFRKYRTLTLSLDSPDAMSVDVCVKADHGAGPADSRIIFARNIRGTASSPFRFAVPSARCEALHISVEGSLSPSARLYGFDIENIG